MPTYPVKNLKTANKRNPDVNDRVRSMAKDNPDWDKDWMQGVANVGEVGKSMINFVRHTPVGMMYYTKHLKLPVLK